MLSQTSEYALRAMVCLAADGQSLTSKQLAERTQVPSNYLSKLMQTLRRAGLIHAQRGVGGGFELTRPAEEISVLAVVDAIDPLRRIHECPLRLAEHRAQLCPMHKCLDDAIVQIQQSFGGTSIADLAASDSPSIPLCGTPLPPPTA